MGLTSFSHTIWSREIDKQYVKLCICIYVLKILLVEGFIFLLFSQSSFSSWRDFFQFLGFIVFGVILLIPIFDIPIILFFTILKKHFPTWFRVTMFTLIWSVLQLFFHIAMVFLYLQFLIHIFPIH